MSKEACVTAFTKFYRIHSWAVFGASKLDPDGIDADHPPDLDDAALGAVAREALLASRFIGPDHPDWDRVHAFWSRENSERLLERLKARAGVKTHGALYSGVGEVGLILKNGIINLRPKRYEGRGGFGPLRGDHTVELPETVSDEELGAAIRHLVDVSRRPWRY
ncbi:contact-dependent growth inhibition system immunity protein [Amorphus orientalis]|uniref:CdiI family contact-dependent growth inhibition immunity protein n=1 Tax=Amorphus orientalis TaxID=649198 RepID=A0AAE3VNV0_9HYPH|nr:contact-dependent growth inhibition system immunity protein [Amorphus orientalis]MDQ0315503.1 hypothetical protein [Amorphus orientalis]